MFSQILCGCIGKLKTSTKTFEIVHRYELYCTFKQFATPICNVEKYVKQVELHKSKYPRTFYAS